MRTRKILYIILGIVVVALIIVCIWALVDRIQLKKEQAAIRNINVQALEGANEQKIGTIYYPSGKVITETAKDGTNEKAVFETTDSLQGAVGIYYQDILNRYKNYNVNQVTVTKDDALNNKAVVITCSGKTGKITITIWAKTNGMTQVEVVTSGDFK